MLPVQLRSPHSVVDGLQNTRDVHNTSEAARGSTILEVLLAVVIIGVALAGAATLMTSQNRSITSSVQLNQAQNQIDADVAAVRNLAETYTWCSGAGGFNGSATNCAGAAARNENYYFPVPTATAAIAAFETACKNTTSDTLNTTLVTAISSPALPNPSLVTRAVTQDRNDAFPNGDFASHRLRITYTSTTGASRVVLLVPTVAAWCP